MISHDARSQRWLLSTLRRLSGTHIDDTIGPVARLRVFRGRLSIPKVIARWFSKSSCGAGHGDLVLSQQKLRTNNGKLQEKNYKLTN